MSVTFTATDSTRPRTTPFGTFSARVEVPDWPFGGPHWNAGNARALLGLLGLANEELCGEATLPELRRALLAARARFDRRAPEFVREERVEYGAPREVDGVVELRPLRLLEGGLDLAGIRTRLEELAEFVEAAAALGADAVSWG
jgi:hypothetical protein